MTSVAPGDRAATPSSPHAASARTAARPKTSLRMAIREQQNRATCRTASTRLSRGDEPIRHFMGTSTFAEATVMPEIALAKVSPDAPPNARAVRVRPVDRAGRGDVHRQGRGGLDVRRLRRGAGRARRGRRARLQGAERIVCVDLSQDRLELARGQGATDVMVGGEDTVERVLEMTGGFGADYTFEATGNVEGDAPGRRVRAHGLGPCTAPMKALGRADAHSRPQREITRNAADADVSEC